MTPVELELILKRLDVLERMVDRLDVSDTQHEQRLDRIDETLNKPSWSR